MTDDIEPPGRRITELPDAAHVIGCFGGIRPTASLLRVAVSTVQGWKERGAIPRNRHQAILEVAAEHGVDLADDASPVPVRSSTPPAEPSSRPAKSRAPSPPDPTPSSAGPTGSARTQSMRPNRKVAWLALTLVGAALIAVFTQPRWGPVLFPDAARDGAVSPSTSTNSADSQLATIERRISVLEGNYEGLTVRTESAVSGAELASLNDRIAALKQSATADSPIEGLVADISTLGDRLAVLELNLAGQGEVADQGSVNASVVALSAEVAAWSARLASLEAAPVGEGGTAASLVLAIGQLDAAVRTGEPFASALERVQTLAGDDFIVAGALAPLAVWAEDGIPTVAVLGLRFRSLLPELTQPAETSSSDDGWWPRLRSRLTGLVTIRRIDKGDDLSPLARSEQAVERGDLEAAVTALEGAAVPRGEAAQSWISNAKARLAAESALASLAAHGLDVLANVGAATP